MKTNRVEYKTRMKILTQQPYPPQGYAVAYKAWPLSHLLFINASLRQQLMRTVRSHPFRVQLRTIAVVTL